MCSANISWYLAHAKHALNICKGTTEVSVVLAVSCRPVLLTHLAANDDCTTAMLCTSSFCQAGGVAGITQAHCFYCGSSPQQHWPKFCERGKKHLLNGQIQGWKAAQMRMDLQWLMQLEVWDYRQVAENLSSFHRCILLRVSAEFPLLPPASLPTITIRSCRKWNNNLGGLRRTQLRPDPSAICWVINND